MHASANKAIFILLDAAARHWDYSDTGFHAAMTPAYARAPRGQRVVGSAPASWGTVTVIAA